MNLTDVQFSSERPTSPHARIRDPLIGWIWRAVKFIAMKKTIADAKKKAPKNIVIRLRIILSRRSHSE